jgi:hypothetical protein
MIIAVNAVHTTGVNWESVAAIAGCVAVIVTIVIWIFNRRDKRTSAELARREQLQREQFEDIRRDFTDSINHLSEVLLAKLETKETVAQISNRLARLEGAAGAPMNSGH